MCSKIPDKLPEIENLHVALRAVGFSIDYKNADLITRVVKKLNEKLGKTCLDEILAIRCKCADEWDSYEKNLKK